MGIVFCIFKFFRFGGLQQDFLRIATECRDRGYKVIVYTFSWTGNIPEGLEIRIVPNKYYSNHAKAQFFSNWIEKELEKNYYQIVVGFNRIRGLDLYFAGDNCLREYAFTKKPFLYRIVPRFLVFSSLEKAVFKNTATDIFILTEKQKKDYIKHYATEENRFHLLPPGVSSSYEYQRNHEQIKAEIRKLLNITDDKTVLIQIASCFLSKGVSRSIKALASLPHEIRNNTVLLIVGNDNPRHLVRLSKWLKIKKQVYFLGGRNDVKNLLLCSDLMIHPARNEATGTVLIEALMVGLPVICSYACGYSSFIKDSSCGKVLPLPFRQKELNKKLLELLINKNQLQSLGQSGQNFIKKINLFNRHKIAADIIEEVIKKKSIRNMEACNTTPKNNLLPVNYLYLREDFSVLWKNKNPFEEVKKLTGKIFRLIKNRRTLQFDLKGKRFFIKIHNGIGWKEIFKNLLQLKKPVIGARSEWNAINKLKELQINTMTVCAFGERGKNIATQESFIITETLENTINLEDFSKTWKKSVNPALKYALIKQVAETSRKLHTNNINHRDYYICHFLMDISYGIENITPENLKLYLIDLHRTQIRRKTPLRWIIKDVSGIWFSSMDIGLTKRDLFRFMKVYFDTSFRKTVSRNKFWSKVNKTAKQLYKKEHGKLPVLPF